MKTRYKVYAGVMAVVVVASVGFGLLGFLNMDKKQKEFVCENNISFKLLNDLMLINNRMLPCKEQGGYLLCKVSMEEQVPYMDGYVGLRERDKRLFMLVDIKFENINDEKIRQMLKYYGKEKTVEYMCETFNAVLNRDLLMCAHPENYQCREI